MQGRTSLSVIVTLSVLALQVYADTNPFPCTVLSNFKTYSLINLQSKNFSSEVHIPAASSTAQEANVGSYVAFRVCAAFDTQAGKIPPPSPCDNDMSTSYLITGDQCKSLTPGVKGDSVSWSSSILPATNSSNETFVLTSSNPALSSEHPYNIKLKVTCDKSVTNSDLVWTSEVDGTTIILSTRSYYGCGYSINELITLFKQDPWVTAPVLAIIGLIICLVGHRLLRYTLALIGFVAG